MGMVFFEFLSETVETTWHDLVFDSLMGLFLFSVLRSDKYQKNVL